MGFFSSLVSRAATRHVNGGLRLGRFVPSSIKRRIMNRPDVLIDYDLCGHTIRMPLTHPLRNNIKAFPQYDMNLGRVAKYVAAKYPKAQAVDIGANIGDTAVIMSMHSSMRVLCVEGNPAFLPLLKSNIAGLSPACEIEESYVGSEAGSAQCAVDTASGTSTLTMNTGATTTVKIMTLGQIVERHPAFGDVRLIKIDTDGYDCDIIRSSGGFLSRQAPAVFFEYDPYYMKNKRDDAVGVFESLRDFGYDRIVFYDNIGDYLAQVDLQQTSLLEDLMYYMMGRKSFRYWDLCAFHRSDADLALNVRNQELAFFQNFRPGGGWNASAARS